MNKNEFLNSKICKNFNDVKFSRWLAYWRFKAEKTVFVFGDFDFMHYGNMKLLTEAAENGSVLIVGVNNFNKKYLHEVDERSYNVAAHHYVDYVVYNPDENPIKLIELIKPNIIFKTSQQELSDEIVKFAKENDITIKTFNCPEGFSNIEFKEKLQNYLK